MRILLLFHQQIIGILAVFLHRIYSDIQPLYELIRQLGKRFHTDAVHRHGKHRILSGHFFSRIILGEGHVHVQRFSALRADQPVLKAIDERAGTDGQIIPLCGSSVKRHTVNLSFIIDVDDVALFHRPVRNLRFDHIALEHIIDIAVQILIRHHRSVHGYFYSSIFSKRHIICHIDSAQIGFRAEILRLCLCRVFRLHYALLR